MISAKYDQLRKARDKFYDDGNKYFEDAQQIVQDLELAFRRYFGLKVPEEDDLDSYENFIASRGSWDESYLAPQERGLFSITRLLYRDGSDAGLSVRQIRSLESGTLALECDGSFRFVITFYLFRKYNFEMRITPEGNGYRLKCDKPPLSALVVLNRDELPVTESGYLQPLLDAVFSAALADWGRCLPTRDDYQWEDGTT